MNLGNVIDDWMGLVWMMKRMVSWVSLLAPPLLHILGLGFLQALLTSAALLLSSLFFFLFFTLPNPKHRNVLASSSQQDTTNVNVQEQEREREPEVSFLDESESSTNTEDSEYCVETTTDISDDGSISDEESLIELSLPSGHYVRPHCGNDHNKGQDHDTIKSYKDKNKTYHHHHHLHKNIKDLRLFEILAEFNDMIEEDNLIEIDISIGSIKCSRFEIEA